MSDKQADLAGPGIGNYEELEKILPDYKRKELKKKHRYLYVLHKKDRKKIKNELKHPLVDYPKDNDNCGWGKKK